MITFLGDVALISDNLKSNYKPSAPYTFNHEYVLRSTSILSPTPNKINLSSEQHDFESIFSQKPFAVNIINNHTYDFGEPGLESTIKALQTDNIDIIDDRPYFFNESVCLLAYTTLKNCGFNTFDQEKAESDIECIKSQNPTVKIIIQIHWGIENSPTQNASQTDIAHRLIDKGADLIIGHHPHCIQPIEQYKGKYICYSLGNCLFGNINQFSHYDLNGKPQRKYRFKWQKWNRTSLSITYNEMTEQISVDELIQRKNILYCRSRNAPLKKYMKQKGHLVSKIIYTFRKYYLFFISNAFVDGKFFDMNAIRAERQKNG